MGRFLRAFLALLTAGLVAGSANAQTPLDGAYTINSALATGGRNFKTFGDAVAALTANGVSKPVIFNVTANSGPYNEQVLIKYINGTSITNTITFSCNNEKLTFRSEDVNQQAGVKLDGAHHIIFENLIVEPQVTKWEVNGDSDADGIITTEYGTGFHLVRDADSNIIRKCTVTNTYDGVVDNTAPQNVHGISINGSDEAESNGVSDCDGNILQENTIVGGYYGIILNAFDSNYPVTTWTSNNNQVINNTVKDYIQSGIVVMQNSQALIQGNDISSTAYRGYGYAIFLNEGNSALRLIGNRIHGMRKSATYPYSVDFTGIKTVRNPGGVSTVTTFANNVIYDIDIDGSFTGIDVDGDLPQFGSCSFINIYHNTIAPGTGGAGDNRGIYIQSNNATNINIVNNNIAFMGTVGSSAYLLQLPKPVTGFTLSRNNYYTNAASAPLIRYGTVNYSTIATWQAVAGYDAQSVSVDPLFVNYGIGDLKPAQAVLDGRARFVGIDKDVLNITRNATTPDVGAYEFTVNPCVTPVVAGTSGVVPNIVCEGLPAGLDLTGNTSGDGQTYQWMSSTTENGTYTNVGGALKTPALDITGTATLYYKVQVTCGTDTKTSAPALLMVNPVLPRGVYTINAKQPYGNGNYRSFTEALQALSCGISGPVIFEVAKGSGPYNEQIVVPAIQGSSAINTVTFNGNFDTLVSAATTSAQRGVILLNNTAHIIFRNLVIKADASNNAIGVQAYNNTDSCSIIACKVLIKSTSSNTAGIAISGAPTVSGMTSSSTALNCDDILVDSCIITGGYYGILNYAPSGTPVYRNKFTNNTITDYNYYGIYCRADRDALIKGNDISRPNMTTASEAPFGIWVSYMLPGIIANNKVHDLAKNMTATTLALTGIYLEESDAVAGTTNQIVNNAVWGFNNKGAYTGIYNNGCNNTLIYHNTVTFEDQVLVARANYGIRVGSVTGVEVKNNLITLKRNTTTTSWALYAPASGYVSDYNDIVVDAANTAIKTGRSGSTDCLTMALWRSTAKQDANSVVIDPKFTDVTTGNLKPTEVTLKNKGVGIGVIRDIIRARRNLTTPDVGAFEFACVNPTAELEKDSIAVCSAGTATFAVKTPDANNIYEWYSATTNDDYLTTGTQFTTPAAGANVTYYMETVNTNGCGSGQRIRAKVQVLEKLQPPLLVKADLITGESVRFAWNAVPGAKGYQVSRNHINFTAPSPDPNGLTHTVNGLKGGDTLSLVVKATADLECQAIISDTAFARTLTYVYFVPNMFSPNGDGKNDEFRVYGNTIQSLKLMVFNQWGQKVFEASDKNNGWNGTFNGGPAPVGVYMYVSQINFTNGTTQTAKGSFTLIR